MKTFLTLRISEKADDIIEKSCKILNYREIKINGDDEVNISTMIRAVFERMAEDKNKRGLILESFLTTLELHRKGEKISTSEIKKITEEIINEVR